MQDNENTKPKILKSFVSAPIFVDSRKSVRDAQKLNVNNFKRQTKLMILNRKASFIYILIHFILIILKKSL